jgi:acetyl-CoA C-acetyltransferase
VVIPQRKKDPIVFDTDEYPKRDTSLEKMAKLKPIFADGVTTAGNASGRNDGASALVIMSAERRTAWAQALRESGRLRGRVDPGSWDGPCGGDEKAHGAFLPDMKLEDFGLIELNEAFAAQSWAVSRNWGSISKRSTSRRCHCQGHPLGCRARASPRR